MPIDHLARCRAIATSTWSDALDQLGIRGVPEALAVRSGSGSIAGLAVTVRETPGELGTYPTSAFKPAAFLEAAGTNTVIVIDIGGALISSCGGLVAQAAKQQGVAGIVIDGGCRDLADIRATGVWVASRHVTPTSGRGRVRVDAVNVPVTIGGVAVAPGDYIVGDETGVACIPAGRIEDALAIAEELTLKDTRFSEALRDGHTFAAASAQLRHV